MSFSRDLLSNRCHRATANPKTKSAISDKVEIEYQMQFIASMTFYLFLFFLIMNEFLLKVRPKDLILMLPTLFFKVPLKAAGLMKAIYNLFRDNVLNEMNDENIQNAY